MKLLVTVKAYPIPSRTSRETVCTAGVTVEGELIRIYPIPYRYLPKEKQYKKYQWIELDVIKAPKHKDPRLESYKPASYSNIDDIDSLARNLKLGEIVGTNHGWAERKSIVLQGGVKDMCNLMHNYKTTNESLGIVKPNKITKFTIEDADNERKPRQRKVLEQQSLFLSNNKPLAKLPYKFCYHYLCTKPGCKGHKMMIEDREISELYRSCKQRYNNEATVKEKIYEKYMSEFSKKDLYFYVGSTAKNHLMGRKNPFVIIGVFYPPN